jgi:hypothetical protein
MKKPKPARKLDLFVVLEQFDRRVPNVYNELTADPAALKELCRDLGYILPLWMTGAARDDDHMELIRRFNRNCNLGWFGLSGKYELQARLLASIGLGRKVAHRFSKVRAATRNTALFDLLTLSHPDIRSEEVRIWAAKNTAEDAAELARGYGWTDEQIETLLKNYVEVTL